MLRYNVHAREEEQGMRSHLAILEQIEFLRKRIQTIKEEIILGKTTRHECNGKDYNQYKIKHKSCDDNGNIGVAMRVKADKGW